MYVSFVETERDEWLQEIEKMGKNTIRELTLDWEIWTQNPIGTKKAVKAVFEIYPISTVWVGCEGESDPRKLFLKWSPKMGVYMEISLFDTEDQIFMLFVYIIFLLLFFAFMPRGFGEVSAS